MVEDLRKAFLRRYPKREKVLKYYEEATGVPPEWGNLNKANIQAFCDLLNERLSQNSARLYAQLFKFTISLYSDSVRLPENYEKTLKLRTQRVVNTWCDEKDLEALTRVTTYDDDEESVWASFLIGAYTGARHSDFLRFDETNIVNGMLTYVSQKTKIQSTVPLKPIVARLIPLAKASELDDGLYNETLRNLCQRAGINKRVKVFKGGREQVGPKYQFISSHTARRSFATNLYLRNCDIYAIGKMMGHTNIHTTEGYICCGLRELPDRVMGYFQ